MSTAEELVNRWALAEGKPHLQKLLEQAPNYSSMTYSIPVIKHLLACNEAFGKLKWWPATKGYSELTPGEPEELEILLQCSHGEQYAVSITEYNPPALVLRAVKWCLEHERPA